MSRTRRSRSPASSSSPRRSATRLASSASRVGVGGPAVRAQLCGELVGAGEDRRAPRAARDLRGERQGVRVQRAPRAGMPPEASCGTPGHDPARGPGPGAAASGPGRARTRPGRCAAAASRTPRPPPCRASTASCGRPAAVRTSARSCSMVARLTADCGASTAAARRSSAAHRPGRRSAGVRSRGCARPWPAAGPARPVPTRPGRAEKSSAAALGSAALQVDVAPVQQRAAEVLAALPEGPRWRSRRPPSPARSRPSASGSGPAATRSAHASRRRGPSRARTSRQRWIPARGLPVSAST